MRHNLVSKYTISKFLLICLLICGATNPYPSSRKVRVVVIDAGHGGSDPGCHGLKHFEKDVALSITLKVGKYIEENIKDVKVVYTRKTDVFVPLNEIASHANKNNADLFICIHCNAAVNKQVFGSETYVMGLHKTKGNLEVAKRENASILFEEDYKKKYEGFDPNSDEANIIFNMYQNAFLEQSLSYASKVQEEFRKNKNLTDKGVKQAGFLVLWKTSMPSVLIETGFLTNAEEEKYLGSQKGQDQIAFAIYKAFKNYKAEVEGYDAGPENEIRPRISEEQVEAIEQHIHQQEKDTIKSIVNQPENKILFKIQIANSSKKIPLNSPKFGSVKNVEELLEDKTFKYLTGNFKTMEEAFDEQRRLRKQGFEDAFTVAFINGKKSSMKEARELLAKKDHDN
ncbi:MAG: N-acetylmuramoyl-L-alanine amidase [Bacteroidota bacterium]